VAAPLDRGQVFRLFEQALGREGADREQFIRDHCTDDAALEAELQALLAIAAKDSELTSSLLPPLRHPAETLIGREFGHFRLVELIGEGGMGVVYRAERTDGLQQTVALKLIASEMLATGQQRFQRETQLLARLEHPAIARLIDAGVESGRAWIALEFVRGRPIDQYCEEQKLTVRERVRLLVLLAGAVGAAHRLLVVHRDIKPANVLVTADGLPKLIDFGIGTLLHDAGAPHLPTADIGRLFTPQYAAPEQVSGEPVTVATDVFGLGALGYRLLTGRVPYPHAKGPIGYLLALTHQDADIASRAFLAEGGDPHQASQLRGDLDAILNKALERDPARRYAAATDLQADLQRYLDDVPVLARVPTFWLRAGKFVRRNSIAVSLSTLLGTSLVAGAIAYGIQAHGTAEARKMGARRGEFLESLLKSADPRSGRRDVTVAGLLDASVHKLDDLSITEPLTAASMLGLVAETNRGLGRYQDGLSANTRELSLLRSHGGSPTDLAAALITRGQLLQENGETNAAEAPLREALKLLGGEHSASKQSAEAQDALGTVLTNSGREREAESSYRSAIDLYRRVGGPSAALAAYPLDNLGVLLANEGHYSEAAAANREALAIQKNNLPPDHPDLLATEMNYASSLVSNHQAAAAEALFREVIAVRHRVLGPDHKDTLIAQTELADDLFEQHRDAEAAAVERPAADGLSRVLGERNYWTLAARGTYGIAACRSGQEGGLAVLQQVKQVRAQMFGENDWHTLSTEVAIGTCMVTLHRYALAEPLLLQAAAGLETVRGPSFHRTQAAYQALRDLYTGMQLTEEADRWQSKILPAFR
jgi:serine/threonine-protein kinase